MKPFIPLAALILFLSTNLQSEESKRPNFLFAISDDQSYPHASAYGDFGIKTPAFDRMAAEGLLFHSAFVAAPQCSPNRAAILTGRNIWQLEEAGTHGSYFPAKFQVFTRALENHGYHVGFTGKPWSPGNWEDAGWDRNPVGTRYADATLEPPTTGIKRNDYASNFEAFLENRKKDQPFFFWYGASEPHLDYEYGSGLSNGKSLDEAVPPPFIPRSKVTQTDYLDYAFEIEWFDQHLGRMLDHLESIGELENTIVVVTSDNGMPFPYAKANLQEFGIHVPLVIAGPRFFPGGRVTRELVSHTDLAPTFLEMAGASPLPEATGKSLVPFLTQGQPHRDFALSGRERHTHARPDNLGYPARSIRTDEFLLIWNMKPDRWPAGNPIPEGLTPEQLDGSFSPDYKGFDLGYEDIDSSATKTYLLTNPDAYPDLVQLATGKRPEFQLYNIVNDPWCLNDLSRNPGYSQIKQTLHQQLLELLQEQGDPRVHGNGDIFESYPRHSVMRLFPGFSTRSEYNPEFQSQKAAGGSQK